MLSIAEWHTRYTEQARWTKDVRRTVFDRICLKDCSHILEVGSGTGAVLADVSHYSSSPIYGVDIQLSFLKFSKEISPGSPLACSDGMRLPFPAGSFDMVYCHFFLLWANNQQEVLQEICRVTRSGGWILALAEPDYGGRIDYPESLSLLGKLQADSLNKQGADPCMGRKLAHKFSAAGLKDVHTGVLGGEWDFPQNPMDNGTEWPILENDLSGTLTEMEMFELRRLDASSRHNGSRILFVPTFYAWAKR